MIRSLRTATSRQDEFQRLALPHSAALLRVARRIASDRATADDLVQEALLRAWRSFDQFQPGTNARAWLFRILFNVFYAHGRKIRLEPPIASLESPSSESGPVQRSGLSPLDAVEVNRALVELSSDHRAVILLAIVEGFTCREIGEILSVPLGTVMSRLSRARQVLRDKLTPAKSVFLAPTPDPSCIEREAS
ncbi:MAG TPA: sigma-70 family RNA polymerase sigma factor [Candidatus Acidoferrales bacterium]